MANPNNPKQPKHWLSLFLSIFGVFFLLLAAQEGCYQKAVKLKGIITDKHYTPATSRTGSGTIGSSSRHSIRYTFTTPEGETKESWSQVLTQNYGKIQKGDSIDIEYLPAIHDSRIPGQTASAPVFLFMGIVLLTARFIMMRRLKGKI